MATYIVAPKLRVGAVRLDGRPPVTGPRAKAFNNIQRRQVRESWRHDTRIRAVNAWTKRNVPMTARTVAGPPTAPVSGVMLLDLSPDAASELSSAMPEFEVFEDRPLRLIPPARNASPHGTAADGLWHLDAIRRSTRPMLTGKEVVVAVLDTGIDDTHPEIIGKVVASAGRAGPGRAWVAEPRSRDTDGHGTHVAGLICGTTVGVAPDARLLNGIMIPNGHGMVSDFILAIEWAALRADVAIMNMSAGIPGYDRSMQPSIDGLIAAGILPIIAVGNEGSNRTRSPGNYSNVVSVGATSSKNRVAAFSGSGALVVDAHTWDVPTCVAPGKGITSCVMGGGYATWEGTSMATPIVSGIAALIIEEYGGLIETAELVDQLHARCVTLESDPPRRYGRGLAQVV